MCTTWGTGTQDVPVADAKPEDIQDLLGGALFKALYKWMEETGPVYLLPTGTLGCACHLLTWPLLHCASEARHSKQACARCAQAHGMGGVRHACA